VSARRHLLRASAYLDSVVLLQLQRELAAQPGVEQAAAVMATPANCELLAASGLLPEELPAARPDDLVVVVAAVDEASADAALARIDELLAARRPSGAAHRPRSLDGALRQLPAARWVLVSVPGRYAADVARRALAAGRHVFLFSDNVPLDEEVALKREAARHGLLVLGPDCGTAVVAGAGLGFANRVRRGAIGVVAASGTGLQALCCHLDALGEGVSHALGTGGRDLGAAVGGATAAQALALLGADDETRVVVLISKPPAPAVAGRLLTAAASLGKPVVAWLLGTPAPGRQVGGIWFAASAADAADLAARLARESREGSEPRAGERGFGQVHEPTSATGETSEDDAFDGDTRRLTAVELAAASAPAAPAPAGLATETSAAVTALDQLSSLPAPRYVRALFGGGTLALQAVAGLQLVCDQLSTNVPLRPEQHLADPRTSRGHCVVDLGADELTAGRPHPMLEPALLVERLLAEANDPEVGLILFDLVLGDGAHRDPAAAIAPAVATARAQAAAAGRELKVVALVQGTAADPQGVDEQVGRLADAGALVCRSVEDAVGAVWSFVAGGASAGGESAGGPAAAFGATALSDALASPFAAVNVGLEVFYDSLQAQGAAAVHVDWRPPAGGDARLAELLRRMR
jgi:FdrA protein